MNTPDNNDWVERSGRVGLLAYGVVHLVIGWLALQLAFGDRAGSASAEGAIHELAQKPFGEVLVWLVAVGLFLLTVWQGIEAIFGHRNEEGATRVRKRVTSAGKAVVYAVIGVTAVRVAVGSGQSKGGTDSTTAKIMDLPGGQLLVGAVGLGIIGVGAYFVFIAWSEKLHHKLDAKGKAGASGTAYLWLGRIGFTAKGIAFGIVGSLFGYAALTHEANKSGGLDQALVKVLDQPYGPALLAAIALGFGCFGVFCFARARHLAGN